MTQYVPTAPEVPVTLTASAHAALVRLLEREESEHGLSAAQHAALKALKGGRA